MSTDNSESKDLSAKAGEAISRKLMADAEGSRSISQAAPDAPDGVRPHVLKELHNMAERCRHHIRNGEYDKANSLVYIMTKLGVDVSAFVPPELTK